MSSSAEDYDLLRRCLDGSAVSADYDRAEGLIADDPQLAASLRDELALEALIGTALRAEDARGFARRITARVCDQGNSRRFARSMRHQVTASERNRIGLPRWPWLAVAALVLALISLWQLAAENAPQRRVVAQIHGLSGTIELTRSGREIPLDEGLALVVGDTIRTTGNDRARIHMRDGSEIRLAGPARITLESPTEWYLHHGEAGFTIQPRQAEARALTTPQARIEVLGTQFDTMVADERTTVSVAEGLVQLLNLHDWSQHRINAGNSVSTPVARKVEFIENWNRGIANWQVVGDDMQLQANDANGFTVHDNMLQLSDHESLRLLGKIPLRIEPGRYRVSTRIRVDDHAAPAQGIRVGLALRGESRRLASEPDQDLPPFVPGQWHRVVMTIDIQQQPDGSRRIDSYQALASEDIPAQLPQRQLRSLWIVDKPSEENTLHLIIAQNGGPATVAPLRIERLLDDTL